MTSCCPHVTLPCRTSSLHHVLHYQHINVRTKNCHAQAVRKTDEYALLYHAYILRLKKELDQLYCDGLKCLFRKIPPCFPTRVLGINVLARQPHRKKSHYLIGSHIVSLGQKKRKKKSKTISPHLPSKKNPQPQTNKTSCPPTHQTKNNPKPNQNKPKNPHVAGH